MDFGISQWFLSVFPHGGELVRLFGNVTHACSAVTLLALCLFMFSLLIRVSSPREAWQQLHERSKETKTALRIMQSISAVAFAIPIAYLVMREPRLSFAMIMGSVFIVLTGAIFFIGVRIVLRKRVQEVLLQNKMTSAVEIGLLHVAWSLIMLGSMASRY